MHLTAQLSCDGIHYRAVSYNRIDQLVLLAKLFLSIARIPPQTAIVVEMAPRQCTCCFLSQALLLTRWGLCLSVGSLELNSGPVAEFFSQTAGQMPEERAVSLEKFQQLEAAHEAASHEGQTETPSRDDKLDKHFIAFVQVDGHLYELGEWMGWPRGGCVCWEAELLYLTSCFLFSSVWIVGLISS